MNRTRLITGLLGLLLCCGVSAQQPTKKSDLQQRAEAADAKNEIASARYLYIRAYEDYAARGLTAEGVECGVKGASLYYKKENYYKEAFDLLRRIDQTINAAAGLTASQQASQHYLTTKERMLMYLKLRRPESARDQLAAMENLATTADNEQTTNDLLYTKAVYYYTFGLNAQGNAVFKEMVGKLTATKEYDKIDEVYRTLIANSRKSGNASLVAQSYSNYMAWKDSVSALKLADETGALKQQIATGEAALAEKDSTLSTRKYIIGALCVLAVALAAALAVAVVVLLRFVVLTRKQKKTIREANETGALKSRFINNISAQLSPTLQRLDSRQPEVKALTDFAEHIQTLSALECGTGEPVELEDTKIPQFCESLMDEVRPAARSGVTLTVNAPKMSAMLNRQYVTHILRHLLSNAVGHTTAGGSVCLEYKKRGAHSQQFLVTDTGEGISAELRDDIFKPFREVRDLTTGDGLGLPICKKMAQNMGGDLAIDPQFTKGTRFVLSLQM